MPPPNQIDVYLEIGKKRTFAGAIDWPGWCRSGRDPASALQALLDNGPRYARALRSAKVGFTPPADVAAFRVVERLKGDATTDFGAPGIAPSSDKRPVDDAELKRLETLLQACWRAFDAAAKKAVGKELVKGPRGGGRELDKMIEHVLDADASYLSQVGGKFKLNQTADPRKQLAAVRHAMLGALAASARGEVPARGPRGGVRWTARYFVRRAAWHALDHAWEIEDRVVRARNKP